MRLLVAIFSPEAAIAKELYCTVERHHLQKADNYKGGLCAALLIAQRDVFSGNTPAALRLLIPPPPSSHRAGQGRGTGVAQVTQPRGRGPAPPCVRGGDYSLLVCDACVGWLRAGAGVCCAAAGCGVNIGLAEPGGLAHSIPLFNQMMSCLLLILTRSNQPGYGRWVS